MFVVFAQNDVVLDDDILGRRKISFQPFEKQRNKSISFLKEYKGNIYLF